MNASSSLHGLCNFNRFVIVYEEHSKKHFEKIHDYVVEVCHNQLEKKIIKRTVSNHFECSTSFAKGGVCTIFATNARK